jgi:hypothetical protein
MVFHDAALFTNALAPLRTGFELVDAALVRELINCRKYETSSAAR